MERTLWGGNLKKHTSQNLLIIKIMRCFYKDVNDMLIGLPIKQLLDVGCGEGFITAKIKETFPFLNITGIDIEKEYIKYASEHFKNIKFIKDDIFKSNISDESFDIVICNQVLEHLNNYEEALDVIIKKSKKYILISVPNEPFFRIANICRLKYLFRLGNTPGHINNWSIKQFKLIMKEKGDVKKFKTSTFWNICLIEKY